MKLDDQDQITYLANVILLANADGAISPKEMAALEEMRTTIGAKKSTFNAAMKKALSGSYAPMKLGKFAAEVNNFADFLYISIVDGAISEPAKKIISEFSKNSNLTEEQCSLLTKEAIARIKAKEPSGLCPSCKAEVTGDSTYCPKCGAVLKPITPTSEFQIPNSGYAIEFCESTSMGFPAALKFAQSAPSFASGLRNKKTWYLAAWPETAFESVVRLAGLLSGIRNRKCYYNKNEVQWDEIFGFVWCAEQRTKAYRPTEYCFGKEENRLNPWGCKQARMEWAEWAAWFSYGRFEKTESAFKGEKVVWIFDKQRIQHELMTNLHHFRYCPYLRMKLIERVLDIFPDKVEPSDKGPWKYARSGGEVPGSIKVVEVNKSDGIEFKNEYYADGVRPGSLSVLEAILQRAFADSGIPDIKASELVR